MSYFSEPELSELRAIMDAYDAERLERVASALHALRAEVAALNARLDGVEAADIRTHAHPEYAHEHLGMELTRIRFAFEGLAQAQEGFMAALDAEREHVHESHAHPFAPASEVARLERMVEERVHTHAHPFVRPEQLAEAVGALTARIDVLASEPIRAHSHPRDYSGPVSENALGALRCEVNEEMRTLSRYVSSRLAVIDNRLRLKEARHG